jgi:hypothetical protein
MKHEDFINKAQIVSKEYRAVCKTNNRHWIGVWRKTYSEAFNDGDKHRQGNPFHEICIIEKVYSEANIE